MNSFDYLGIGDSQLRSAVRDRLEVDGLSENGIVIAHVSDVVRIAVDAVVQEIEDAWEAMHPGRGST